MGQDPEQIRSEIEHTRERMGDTVEALAYKADVKSRAKDSVNEKMDSIKSKVSGATDRPRRRPAGGGDVKHQRGAARASPRRTRSGSRSAPSRSASSPACSSPPPVSRTRRSARCRTRSRRRSTRPAPGASTTARRSPQDVAHVGDGDREGDRSHARTGRRRGRPAGGTGDPRRGALLVAMWRRASGASGHRSRAPRAAPARCSRAPEEQNLGEQPRRRRAPCACCDEPPSRGPSRS